MDFLLPENGHIDPDDGDYQSKDLVAEKMVHHEPLLICNYEPEILSNERQFNRIFPDTNFENVLDPRFCDVGRCHQDLRKEKFCNQKVEKPPDFSNNISGNTNDSLANSNISNECKESSGEVIQIPFTSGKADPRLYFKAIDTESRLKLTGYSDNLCYVKDYRCKATPVGGDKEVFDKDYRTPVRVSGRMECANLTIPEQNPETKKYYFPQDFMRADQFQNTMFYNNTRRKTMNDW
tara:strand:+ start:199 stop:906 length:708 start_codon:yes stop_codon:yes gene_type:complete